MPTTPAHQPALGAVLAGRYRLLEKLGTGRMGEHYRAVDERTEAFVSIRLLRSGTAEDVAEPAHWFDNAYAGGLFRHPNVIQVEGTGISDFGPFVVTEDLRGEHAKRLLARHGRLRKDSAFAIIEPAFLALSAAHSVGLLHGDVRPEHVLVCHLSAQRMAVKWTEFGGSLLGATRDPNRSNIEYLSPEQLQGKAADHRSEQFSACALLYELLTNSLPFHGPTPAITAERILHAPCPALIERGMPTEDRLSHALLRGLAKEPSRRYSNMRELLEALRSLMQSTTPASALLSELLPINAMLRHGSGMIPSAGSRPPRRYSTPAPHRDTLRDIPRDVLRETNREASAPHTTSAIFPSRAALLGGSDSHFVASTPPREAEAERESLAPVLPSRYRGRYRARAVVWQSLDEYVRSRRPAALRERILYDIGSDLAGDLLLGTLSGIVRCELDPITQYIDLATSRLFSGNPTWCRSAGQEAVAGVLANALTRSIPPTPNVDVTLRRVCRILAPLFDFAEWQVDPMHGPERVLVTVFGLDAVCQGLRLWIVGLMERALAVSHPRPVLTITRGEASFMPRMVVEATIVPQ